MPKLLKLADRKTKRPFDKSRGVGRLITEAEIAVLIGALDEVLSELEPTPRHGSA